MNEFRLALRRLRKRPGATLASMVTLACAISAAAATWSLLSAVLLRPLPIKDAGRLMVVGQPVTGGPSAGTLERVTYPYYPHIRDSGIFETVVATWDSYSLLLVGSGDRPVSARVAFASYDFFPVLGIAIAPGRGFTAEDDRRGAAPVAILTDRYWRQHFLADPEVIGRTITVGGKPATVVGVSARGFRGLDLGQSPDLYLPLQSMGEMGNRFTNYFADPNTGTSPTAGMVIIGRIPSGTILPQVRARLDALGAPPGQRGARLDLMTINAAAIPAQARAGMRQFTRLLGITVGLLLLIGCASVGMLLLVRTEGRRGEFAMCLALGASRARLSRGIALEGAILAIAGATLSLPLAQWLFAGVRTFQLPGRVNIELLDLSVGRAALLATIAAALLATMLIAAIAGWFGFSANIGDALRSRAGATPRLARRRTRALLVAGQVAVALVLVAGAGLFARSLMAALRLNAELGADRVVTTYLGLEPYGYSLPRATGFFDDLLTRLRENPAFERVSYGISRGSMWGALTIDGVSQQLPSPVSFDGVDDHYFRTVGLQVLAGRDFTVDDRATSAKVAIVSESFARLLSGGDSALGHRVTMPFRTAGQPADSLEVVGVVPDVIVNVAALQPLAMYFPIAQVAAGLSRTMTARAVGPMDAARREVISAVNGIDPAVTPDPLITLQERIDAQMSAQHFGAAVLGALGVMAVLLTILGTYVLAESMAVLRVREMGIRAALGATGQQLGTIVLAETARLVGLGLVVGLGLAWLGASTIRAFLFQVEPLDPGTIGGVAALIFSLAMIVSLRPALHAARVDLARVLKDE